MSVPEIRRGLRTWLLPLLMGLLAVAQVVLYLLLIPLLRDQGVRAAQGRQARVQQCAFRSLSLREQAWFREHGVISGSEFRLIVGALPSAADCRAVLAHK